MVIVEPLHLSHQLGTTQTYELPIHHVLVHTTGTGCRGRPPKIRKDLPIQSAVILDSFCQNDNFVVHYFFHRILMKHQLYK